VCQGKSPHQITEITNNVSTRNSPTRKPVIHRRCPTIKFLPPSLTLIDDRLEGSLVGMDRAPRRKHWQKVLNPRRLGRMSYLLPRSTTANWCGIGQTTIDILPDEVLLEIFDCYVVEADEDRKTEEWHILVHVCQKRRYVVFQSPLRLNLRILCSGGTPVRERLAVWPLLPITIRQYSPLTSKWGEDNIIAALGHNDRVCAIYLAVPSSLLESAFAAMQKTFVALKDLELHSLDDTAPFISNSFLGGSAPHLRRLWSFRIPFPFPVLRKLLLSAPNLVILSLRDIPHSAYISPEAMVTCL
jgi:hypothetical protein